MCFGGFWGICRGLRWSDFYQKFGKQYIIDHCTKSQSFNSKRWKAIPLRNSSGFFGGFSVFFGGLGWSNFFFKISDPKQNNISKQCTKSQRCSSKIINVMVKLGDNNEYRCQQHRHQPGKTYCLVEIKFRREKNPERPIYSVLSLTYIRD